MSDYPTNIRKPSYPLGEELVKIQIKTEFANGNVQSRPKFTKHKHIWTLPYPVDCIKSQIQADITYKLNIRSFLKRKELRKNLWRGYLPCVLRSIIVNPFIFFTYEICKTKLFN